MTIKKRHYILLLLSVVCFLSYPFQFAHAGSQQIIKSASEYDYPPFCIVTKDGQADGFSVELLRESLRAVNLDVKFTVGPWAEIKEDLKNGKIQVLPLVGRSPERELIYDFTFSYMPLYGGIFVRKGDSRIKNVHDLSEKEIIVMEGDNAEEYARREEISTHIITVNSYEEAFRLLASGKHDAVVCQKLMGITLLEALKIKNIVPLKYRIYNFRQDFSFAVKEGDSKLLSLLNEGLSIVIADGTFEQLYKKWFGPHIINQMTLPEKIIYVLGTSIPLALFLFVILSFILFLEVKRKTKGLHQEIEDRKKAEYLARENEEKYKALYNNAPLAYQSLDSKGKFVDINPEWSKILGYKREEVIGKSFRDFLAMDWKEKFDEEFENFKKRGYLHSAHFKTKHKDGHLLDIEYEGSIGYGADGQVKQAYCVFKDITEYLRTQDELMRLVVIQEATSDFVSISTVEKRITFINKAGRRMAGIREDADVSTFRISDFHPQWAYKKIEEEGIPYAIKHGSWTGQTAIINSEGHEIPMSQVILSHKDSQGNVQFISMIIRDITELKNAEEALANMNKNLEKTIEERTQQLIASDRLAILGKLSASVAHEINNPLQGMKLHLGILNNEFEGKLQEVKSYQLINNNISRIKDIVTQLLDVHKEKEEKLYAPLNVNDILEEVSAFIENQMHIKNIDFKLILNQNLSYINANKRQIHQVILNLILNAVDSIENYGKITITSDMDDNHVVVKISDTGKGIEPKDLTHLFDPFFSTKGVMGVGLGLFVSQNIIRNHSGKVTVESELGKGSVFTITLPRRR